MDALLEALLAIRKRVPQCRCILAPRWLHEAPEMMMRLSRAGLKVVRRTEFLRTGSNNGACLYDVLVLDTFGELGKLYGVADVAYIGASLVPMNERRAGHNPLEPLVHGIPPLFGPHMNWWRPSVQSMLEIWPDFQVDSPQTLTHRVVEVLEGRAPLEKIRESCAQLMERGKGALERTVAFLQERGVLF